MGVIVLVVGTICKILIGIFKLLVEVARAMGRN